MYCLEWPDLEGGRALDLRIDPALPLKPAVDAKLDGGVTVVRAEATSLTNPSAAAKPVSLVPYYLWANRGVGEMTLWVSTAGYEIGHVGAAGGFIF